ncbi:uncharacterized protein IL334_007582 [Kwoniella shivajii]|uniref:Ribosomal protein L9 domain-containing protein n=1 Tax=Kwoniella shivajii TaxID=564305 RepID=A0ABZ1D924_9TREE|nr:hypothetical protein IL334_007582 [Kwoniella shivajii]
MYASSSRIAINTTLKASRTFSTTSTRLARRETFVELLEDVPGLGRTFDRLFVAPGRARNDLVPTRKARFVPFKDNSQRQVYRATDADRSILSDLRIESPSSSSASSSNEERTSYHYSEPEPTSQSLLNSLHLVPSILIFERRTVSPDYPTLHGSLTLSDIQDKLDKEFNLPSSEIEVSWIGKEQGSRMKELDSWSAELKLRKGGKESIQVTIQVDRLEESQ